MTTLVVCIKRRTEMTPDQFSRYWREVHGPLLQRCTDFTRHLSAYVQHHLKVGESEIARMFGVSGDYDGVAVLTFQSEEALKRAFAEPAYLTNVRPDESNFVDLENSLSFVAEPYVVLADQITASSEDEIVDR